MSIPAQKSVGKTGSDTSAAARNVRFRNLNGAILMSRFRRDELAERYGLKPRDVMFLSALVEFTREWRVVGAGADARVESNEVFVGQARLARIMCCSPNTVAAAAKACTAAGLVVWLGRGKARMTAATGEWTNSTNHYIVTLLASEVCSDAVETVAAVAGENALALVRDTGEKVPAEVSAPSAVAAVGTPETRATETQDLRVAPPKSGAECSSPSSGSKGSSSSSRGGAAKEEEDVPLCLSDGRTVTSAKRGGGGKYGGFLSDGRRFGCDEATVDALRAGAAVEAREQKGGYLWLVEAAQGRSRDAEGLRESRTSDCRTRLLLRPDECRVERDEEQRCWLFYLDGIESPVGITVDEQVARLFYEGKAVVADSGHGEMDGAWCVWRKASDADARSEVALGKPKSADAAAERPRRASWAS